MEEVRPLPAEHGQPVLVTHAAPEHVPGHDDGDSDSDDDDSDYKDSDDDNDDSYNDNDSAVKMNLSASSAILCTWVSSAHSALNTGVGQ